MRKLTVTRASFWDSPIWETLCTLPAEHLRVFLHLVHGPNSHITGIYRLSIGAIADDAVIEPDLVRRIVDDLADTGWCEYEHPIIWIVGEGNVVDQLGKADWTSNPKWLTAAQRHVEALPNLPIVDRFRRKWDLPATLPDAGRHKDKAAPYRKGIDTLSAEVAQTAPVAVKLGGVA